jgi:hypothetical protein
VVGFIGLGAHGVPENRAQAVGHWLPNADFVDISTSLSQHQQNVGEQRRSGCFFTPFSESDWPGNQKQQPRAAIELIAS